MNTYWIISGALMVMGGFAHTIVGEKNVISHLKINQPKTGYDPDVAFNLIRWFWYLGSYVSFFTGAILLIIGLTDDVISNEPLAGKLMAGVLLGFIPTFIIVAALNFKKLGQISQFWILLVAVILAWLGSM